jgi:hypothetical protein
MALLDFMKQGTQWLTDNTGMDWNKVQSDPGLAAKRLMGAPVDLNSQYQAQPTQANLLGTTENIVAAPEMQNRQTFIPDAQQIKPNMGAVNQYNNFDYEENDTVDFYDPLQAKLTQQNGIRLSEGGAKLEGSASQKNAPVIAYDYATRANAPMYGSDLMGQAQDMSLLNAPDDNTMVQKPTIQENKLTILPEVSYENTPYEANQKLGEIKQIEYPSVNPPKNLDDKNAVVSNIQAQDDRMELNKQQAYTVQMIMGSNKSDAEKAALLEQYGINPATYLIPGYEKGALVPGLITKK